MADLIHAACSETPWVLSWVTKGKTNRGVAEILCMIPRTLNKHIDHIFEKLGWAAARRWLRTN